MRAATISYILWPLTNIPVGDILLPLSREVTMSQKMCRSVSITAALSAGLLLVTIGVLGQTGSQPSTKNGEWPYDTADLKGTRYSPLDQINASNFKDLEVGCVDLVQRRVPRPLQIRRVIRPFAVFCARLRPGLTQHSDRNKQQSG